MPQPAVFLDRDGVVNQLVLNPATNDYESPHALNEIEILPGAVAAARALQARGFLLFIVSNQPSYAKGKCALETLHQIAADIEGEFAAAGVTITRGYYCHHHPDGVVAGFNIRCNCRKPAPGNLLHARDAFGADLARSWMIGDQETDVGCARNAGVRSILIQNPLSAGKRPGRLQPDFTARDLPHAVEQLIAALGAGV